MRENRPLIAAGLVLCLFVLHSLLFTAGALPGSVVLERVTVEAGAAPPGVGLFLVNPARAGEARFITDTAALDTAAVGTHPVALEVGGRPYMSALTVTDTMPPTAAAGELYVFEGNRVLAEDTLTRVQDATAVSCVFETAADTARPGWHDARVCLTDAGGNQTLVDTRYYVLGLTDPLTVEAGPSAAPLSRDAFVQSSARISGLSVQIPDGALTLDDVGRFPVTLHLGDYSARATLVVTDTQPPEARALTPVYFTGGQAAPGDFYSDLADATDVRAVFSAPPDLSRPGWQDVRVQLTDEAGNMTELSARCFVFDLVPEVTVQPQAESRVWTAQDFVRNHTDAVPLGFYIAPEASDLSRPGVYEALFRSGASNAVARLRVADTAAPIATTAHVTVYRRGGAAASSVAADAFVRDIADASEVTVSYKTAPDFSLLGRQTVTVVLTDAQGNTAEYDARLTIALDDTPPVITGQLDKTVRLGGTLSYRSGVAARDDTDGAPALSVDNSRVNLKETGTYPVVYTATDAAGNRAAADGTVTVQAVDRALVDAMADEILAEILQDGMTLTQKARAVFDWVAAKVKYQSGNSPRDLVEGAYACFTRGAGDCFVYNAGSQVLLARVGVPFYVVKRFQGKTEHYWLVINTGDGWYHYDASANNHVSRAERFMFTDTQAREYTARIGGGRRYYEYDPATVPDVVD